MTFDHKTRKSQCKESGRYKRTFILLGCFAESTKSLSRNPVTSLPFMSLRCPGSTKPFSNVEYFNVLTCFSLKQITVF